MPMRAAQIGINQIGPVPIRATEPGVEERRIRKIRSFEMPTPKACFLEMRIAQDHLFEHCTFKESSPEVNFGQIDDIEVLGVRCVWSHAFLIVNALMVFNTRPVIFFPRSSSQVIKNRAEVSFKRRGRSLDGFL